MIGTSLLVVTAHVGDFVWRCGGAIALHANQGIPVHVICLSFGENGESNAAWSAAPAPSREEVKACRRAEAETAATLLGAAHVDFLDLGDYPLPESTATVQRIAQAIRRIKPATILTHPERDPSNLDHCRTFNMVLGARMMALAPGHGADIASPAQVMSFEPHQPELCDFKPNVMLDISDVWETKKQAMQAMPTQKNLWAYYERVALQRGAQAGRRGQSAAVYGEAFQSIFPAVRSSLV